MYAGEYVMCVCICVMCVHGVCMMCGYVCVGIGLCNSEARRKENWTNQVYTDDVCWWLQGWGNHSGCLGHGMSNNII